MTATVYRTGSVAVEYNSVTVIGTLTGWAVGLVTGGMFSCRGLSVPILKVNSNTSLTLAYPWPGVTIGAQAYAIARETSEGVRAAWTNDRLAQIIQKLSLVGVHPDGSGTLTERDDLIPIPEPGYLWLYVEPGNDLAFYRQTDTGWDGPFPISSPSTPGVDGTDGVQSSDDSVTDIRAMTQSAYDGLGTYSATTIYHIVAG